MKRRIINPLASPQVNESDTERMTAEAASVDNSVEGVCPKCATPMGTAIIHVGTVYYCSRCRVAAPIPEA